MNSQKYLSLYEYLGRAAGPELGLAVEQTARNQGIEIAYKEITTKTYSGKINMYPREFLNNYFGETVSTNLLYNEPDNLPVDYSDELPF